MGTASCSALGHFRPGPRRLPGVLLVTVEEGRGLAHPTRPHAHSYAVCQAGRVELRTASQPLPHPRWGEVRRLLFNAANLLPVCV